MIVSRQSNARPMTEVRIRRETGSVEDPDPTAKDSDIEPCDTVTRRAVASQEIRLGS